MGHTKNPPPGVCSGLLPRGIDMLWRGWGGADQSFALETRPHNPPELVVFFVLSPNAGIVLHENLSSSSTK